jgi:protein required for attachment to host cells
MEIDTGALVVVADGEKAMLLTNHGTPQSPKLRHLDKEVDEAPADRDIKTDRKHGFSAPSSVPDSAAETDFHRQEKDRFARWLADRLNDALYEKESTEVVLIAPAKTLGEIRHELRDDVRGLVVAEIDKDYTNHPLDEISKLLARSEVPKGIPRTNSHDRTPISGAKAGRG